ncbi:MAG: electron transport complex subunit E [Clostridia bacterium]|jgi:Na+-translocating ferredoxin:NAD+ oxidoreductase subunit E|nr:electron transport complex subunit E [Clostridia bacterium]MBT7121380.1 electron transport complex subunit E [Clostridia bacterium]
MSKQKALTILRNGIFDENPIFRLMLGMCPMLAVTTAAVNGIGMGAASMFVLIGSNVVIALLRNFIPPKIRIPAFIVIIATFVTLVQFLLKAYVPALDKSLGIFIPLIVVNCIILGRAEAFASKNTVWRSFVDAIGMGLGFTVALVIVASIREIIGNGTIFDIALFGDRFEPALIMVGAPGAFITLGLVLALINHISKKRRQRQTRGVR